jgi:hypothetical protein
MESCSRRLNGQRWRRLWSFPKGEPKQTLIHESILASRLTLAKLHRAYESWNVAKQACDNLDLKLDIGEEPVPAK